MAISFGERQSDAAILVPFVRAVQPGLLKSGRRLSPQFTTTEGQNSHPPLPTLDQIMTSSVLYQWCAREGGNPERASADPTPDVRLCRSEERRAGKEWVSTSRSRWSAYEYKQTNTAK